MLFFAGADWAWNLAFFSSLFEEQFARLWGLMLGLWVLSQLLLVALPGEAEGVLASLRCLSVPPSPNVSHCACVTVFHWMFTTQCMWPPLLNVPHGMCMSQCMFTTVSTMSLTASLCTVCMPLTVSHSGHPHQQRDQTHSGKPSE